MHLIHDKQSIFKKLGLSSHRIVTELTRKIIHYHLWCFVEVDIQTGEDIVTAFSPRDLVEAETDQVRTPESHKSSSEGLLLLVG